MFCKKCGSNINEGAGFCPNCGEPVGSGNGQNQVIPPVSALWNMYSQDGQSAGAQSTGQSAGTQSSGTSTDAQFTGTQPFPMQPGSTQQGGFTKGITMEGGFGKFISGHKILLAVVAAVIVVLVLVLVNMETLGNSWRRTFSSPEDYYHYVEKKAVEEFSTNAGELYSRYFLDSLSVSDKSVSVNVDMTLGEGGQELMRLAGLSGVDMSWFESMSFGLDSAMKRDAFFMGLGVVVNGVDIVTGNIVVDLDDETVYLQVPEINEKYIGVEVPGGGFSDMEEVWEMYEMMERVCPDQGEMEKLLNRYLMTAVESMDDVSKEKGVLEAEDIEQKCTVLTVTADINTFKNMTIEILRQIRDDKDIEKIIKDAMGDQDFVEEFYLDDMSPTEAYQEFQEWIDSEVEDLEDLGELDVYDDETLVMNVYVNNKGKIVGRTIEMDYMKMSMLMPEKGKQFGFELSYEDSYFEDPEYDESIALTGSGSRSGDKIDGEFVLAYNNTSIMDLTVEGLNTEEMKKGMLNGSVVMGLSEDIEDLMGYTPGMSMVQGMEFSMDFKSDKTSSSCNMGMFLRDKNIMDIAVSYQKEKGYKGEEPGKDTVMVEDMDDLAKWGKDVKLGTLSKSLKEANVPSEVTDSLELLDGMDMESLFRMMMYYY